MNMLAFPLFPVDASTVAGRVDRLYFFLIGVSAFFILLIFVVILVFALKYRHRAHPVAVPVHGSIPVEIVWTVIPFILVIIMFVWGASLYFDMYRPPAHADEIFVVAKQWMWKFQHPEGPREINELHVPVGRPFKLTMISEDVIHSFFVPAFRVKMDVLPGRYTTVWFEATRTGRYHLFCAEYCGMGHAEMIGTVVVMEPTEFERWLAAGGAAVEDMATAGERLFNQLGCQTCHAPDAVTRGPLLTGRFGQPVQLATGQVVIMDEDHIRQSILDPTARVSAGYEPIMPTYRGLVSEEGILQLIAYIRSLSEPGVPGPPLAEPPPVTDPQLNASPPAEIETEHQELRTDD